MTEGVVKASCDGARVRRRVWARQKDLAIQGDGLLVTDKLKLINEFLGD